MGESIKPIVISIKEEKGFINNLENTINVLDNSNKNILINYPTVYIHNWNKEKNSEILYDVYVGETNDIIKRTKEHYEESKNVNKWQHHLIDKNNIPNMYIIGHTHFNKSLTLDIENKLIHYISSMNNVNHLFNGRGNPQSNYYPDEEFDDIFNQIWDELNRKNEKLFLARSEIENSAIYKASPFIKLTAEQIAIKNQILDRMYDILYNNKSDQLIVVNGEAGTGKTVLNMSTFYEMITRSKEHFNKDIKCSLIVSRDELVTVYDEVMRRLNIGNEDGCNIVSKPPYFINNHSKDNKVDIAFVDEGHLLTTQGYQGYTGKNQLQDIRDRAKIVVLMFDENQILNVNQYIEKKDLEKIIKTSKEQNNYLKLEKQMRLDCSDSTKKWLKDFIDNKTINEFIVDEKGYEVKSFNTPNDLFKAIKDKAQKNETKLSRMIATFDWEYKPSKRPINKKYWDVNIDGWSIPWNNEIINYSNINGVNKKLSWVEKPQTINECGSTFTIQGFDLMYAGVIIGPSVKYRNGKIEFHGECSKNTKATQRRTLNDGRLKSFSKLFIQNELRVLLTRGIKGLYIYACDDALRNKLSEVLEKKNDSVSK